MIIKHGTLFICIGAPLSYGQWVYSNVTLQENNVLKIETFNDSSEEERSKLFHLSSEWFIITPRPTTSSNYPPLPENKKQDWMFALTQLSEITIWFLASSKYDRNQWIEQILPAITLKPPTPPEPPPPYSEYDNLSSYFPWDTTPSTGNVNVREQSPFYFSRPSIHRSGFYSLEKPRKKLPKPVEPIAVTSEPLTPAAEPHSTPEQSRDSLQCVNCFSLGCAFICNTLSVCLQMCCNNFSAAF